MRDKNDTNEWAKLNEEKPTRLKSYTKNHGQLGKAGVRVGKVALPREEHTHWFSSTKWSALKTHIQYQIFLKKKNV